MWSDGFTLCITKKGLNLSLEVLWSCGDWKQSPNYKQQTTWEHNWKHTPLYAL
jgi:hypothetical protein